MNNNTDKTSAVGFSLRPLMFALTIGFAVGLATKNIGVGIAVGIVFAVVFGSFRRQSK